MNDSAFTTPSAQEQLEELRKFVGYRMSPAGLASWLLDQDVRYLCELNIELTKQANVVIRFHSVTEAGTE